MKHRRVVLSLVSLLVIVMVLYAQETQKSETLGPPVSLVPFQGAPPMVDWSQVLALLGVLGAFFGGIQWLITRFIVQPQIRNSVDQAVMGLKEWATETFPSKYQFDLHDALDRRTYQAFSQSIQQVVENQDADHRRLSEIRDRVLRLEVHRARGPRDSED